MTPTTLTTSHTTVTTPSPSTISTSTSSTTTEETTIEITESPTEPSTELPTEPPTTLLPTTTQPIPDFECPFDGIHPHPFECTEYFICAGNVPHLMRCADGLHFNAATLQCDFKENAECDLYSNFI